ncbi:MAG: glycoside hydrolase family 65 protein [Halanaerobiales bacterium]|nr:glycoside hydrolase family 65 protein [Halanaerobiales bacterium]
MLTYHRLKSEKPPLYDYEPWNITEKEFKVENNHHNETIFSLGNGYMGLRGTLEEDYTGSEDETTPGFYINGIYEQEEIIYGEFAPKQPKKYQSMINLMDWTSINVFIDNEKFDLIEGQIEDYKRTLDIKNGLLKRSLIWTTKSNKKVKIEIERLISFEYEHVGAIQYSIKPLNFDGNIKLVSAFDGNVRNHHHLRNKKPLSLKKIGINDPYSYLLMETKNSNIVVGGSVSNNIRGIKNKKVSINKSLGEEKIDETFILNVVEGEKYTLEKYAAFYTSRNIERNNILNNCFEDLTKINKEGFEYLKSKQKDYLQDYWKYSDVKIEGDLELQQAFRYNALQILQSAGKDGNTNVPAKGLTGEYYEGHYFWDTETYIIPFFNYSHPEISKELLNYRYNILDEARENADRMKLDGALFPWRTINGKEASGNFLGSTVQYHINADIAFAINKYVNTTEDYNFLYNKGAELLFETARMWVSLGHFEKLKNNKFCINEACGPDEYKPAVNNNCYTNYMAKFNLEYAVEVYNKLKNEVPNLLEALKDEIELSENEVKKWNKVGRNMYLPYNEELEINPQDDSFVYKQDIDIESIPIKELPLVQNWHPLTIWKYKILKQADVILLMLFMGDNFSLEQKRRNYDYYEPKTTHDSSLSPSIYSIIASEIGYYDDAYNYFLQTARLDLDDYNENTYQGLHTACMGSNWMVLVQGFAGMRNYNGKLSFDPYLPAKWDGYRFKIKYKGSLLEVHVREEFVEYELLEGENIQFKHGNKQIILNKENNYLKIN